MSMKLTTWRALLVALAGLGILAACSTAGGNDRKGLQSDLDEIRDMGATRLLAFVTDEDDKHLVATSGFETENGEPVLSHYHIGSTTETFIATVILQLAGEARLSLDDFVVEHLPRAYDTGLDCSTITIRDLLQHSVVANCRQPSGELGPKWEYSNANYELAGMVIEEVASTTWDEEVYDRIIAPLGLAQTKAGDDPEMPDPSWASAAGGVITTPEDMTRFFSALLSGELLTAEQLAEMQETIPTDVGDDSRYGLGLVWRPLAYGSGYWGHGSSIPGYWSYAGFTEDGVRSVVISNATVRMDEVAEHAQEQAALRLIDNALCEAD